MKIGYSATFNMPNTYMPFEKSWIEEDELLHGLDLFNVTDEDLAKLISNVRKIQYAIRKQVIDFHFESTAAAEKQKGTQVKDVPETSLFKVAELIQQINSCTEMEGDKGLDSYQYLVKGNLSLQNAYDNKYSELNNK